MSIYQVIDFLEKVANNDLFQILSGILFFAGASIFVVKSIDFEFTKKYLFLVFLMFLPINISCLFQTLVGYFLMICMIAIFFIEHELTERYKIIEKEAWDKTHEEIKNIVRKYTRKELKTKEIPELN
jgi:cobalamin biosynthesis protein CobD/CbiB